MLFPGVVHTSKIYSKMVDGYCHILLVTKGLGQLSSIVFLVVLAYVLWSLLVIANNVHTRESILGAQGMSSITLLFYYQVFHMVVNHDKQYIIMVLGINPESSRKVRYYSTVLLLGVSHGEPCQLVHCNSCRNQFLELEEGLVLLQCFTTRCFAWLTMLTSTP